MRTTLPCVRRGAPPRRGRPQLRVHVGPVQPARRHRPVPTGGDDGRHRGVGVGGAAPSSSTVWFPRLEARAEAPPSPTCRISDEGGIRRAGHRRCHSPSAAMLGDPHPPPTPGCSTRSADSSPPPRRRGSAVEDRALLLQHGRRRCPTCQGLGELQPDLQYLPDVPCAGLRREALQPRDAGGHPRAARSPTCSGPGGLPRRRGLRWEQTTIAWVLQSLVDVAWATCVWGSDAVLSGVRRACAWPPSQVAAARHQLFGLDEPSIGLHPRDIHTLLGLDRLLDAGATIIAFIEHGHRHDRATPTTSSTSAPVPATRAAT